MLFNPLKKHNICFETKLENNISSSREKESRPILSDFIISFNAVLRGVIEGVRLLFLEVGHGCVMIILVSFSMPMKDFVDGDFNSIGRA